MEGGEPVVIPNAEATDDTVGVAFSKTEKRMVGQVASARRNQSYRTITQSSVKWDPTTSLDRR
jgi:hypothetical protein